MEVPKKYQPADSEKKWQKYWKENDIYTFNPKSGKPFFTIDTPPPTVSGKMHVGHAFSYSQQDFIARYKRMRGFEVFFPFGTDDNGLATARLVERTNKVRAFDMTRKDFVNLCLKTLDKIRPDFVSDWKQLAISCDYDLFYSTIGEHCQRVSQKSFLELYEKGLEYRKEAPTLWCPECHTAIAQAELEDKEHKSHFNDIIFKVGKNDLIIATTRPELLPACVAIFLHPDDPRLETLEGKKATVPLFEFDVPILADKRVDPDKGSGAVMCCTFGDQTDMEWYFAYNLPLKEAIDARGKMTKLAGKYEGLSVKKAREAILKDLKEAKILVKQKPISHTVNVHERCGTGIEILHSKQWFIKYLDKKDMMTESAAKLKWFPPHMVNRYNNWVQGLQWDWSISRQRHFGIPIPVWYCEDCDEVIIPKESDLPVDPLSTNPPGPCPACKSKNFVPEKDVLDTWATSSLTPQIAAGLVPEMYDKLYPMNFRSNGPDIITFWLFNTVVKSQLHNSVNPWEDVAITGWVLDPHGKKMSKSKGNVVDPREVWSKYSVDAIRFTAAGTKLGEDYPFQEKDTMTGKKTVTKIWNAAKFAHMHLEDYKDEKGSLEAFDVWLITKLHQVIKKCSEAFDQYAYSKAKSIVEKFFWQDFCDIYLELVKDRLYNPDKRGVDARKSGQYALHSSVLSVTKLFAPFMPYITEEIYQLYFAEKEGKKSIHISSWPEANLDLLDKDIEAVGDKLVEVISQVRKAKSEKNISLKEPIKELVLHLSEKEVRPFLDDLKAVTKAEKVSFGKEFHIKM